MSFRLVRACPPAPLHEESKSLFEPFWRNDKPLCLHRAKGGWQLGLGTSGRDGQQKLGGISRRREPMYLGSPAEERFLLGQAKRVPATPALGAWDDYETSFHLFQRLDPTGIQNPAIEIQLFQIFDRSARR